MRSQARFAPSILAADFAHLANAVDGIADRIDMLHVDVMDGHFVPNISLGPPVIASLRASTDMYLDCHLMITDPVRYLKDLAQAGADGVTGHIEAIPNPDPFFARAAELEIDAGLVINPPTPVAALEPYLDRCDKVVVMSVHPGFGGQAFIADVLGKIEKLREIIDSEALRTDIEVDGGIDLQTVGQAYEAGASILVAGTSVFRQDDPAAAIDAMRAVIESSGGT